MSSRLRRRLVGLILGILLATAVFFYWAERRIDDAQRAAAATDLENEVVLLSRTFLISGTAGLDAEVDRISKGSPFRITVTDTSGTVLGDSVFSGEELRRLENHGNRAEFIAAARGETGTRLRYSTSTGRWLLYAAAPLESGLGFIRLAVEQPADPWIRRELRLPLLGLLTCLVLLCIILLVPSISRLSRAKVALVSALDRTAKTGSVTAVPIPSDEELGPVARAAEAASAKISQRIDGLESERNLLTTAFSSMTEAVLVTDSRGRISKVNPAFREIFGIGSETDPIGRRPLELVRNPEIHASIDAALRHEPTREVETRVGDKTLLARFSPFGGEGREGVVMVVHDISQLRHLESLRKDFISNISHELKTPLTSIEGYSETLLGEDGLTPTQRSFLEKIHRNAQALSEMLQDLLNLAQLEKDSRWLPRTTVCVEKLLEDVQNDFSPRFVEKGLSFEIRCQLSGTCLIASEHHLKRVLTNLLENALKYTEEGRVWVEVRTSGQELVFSVSDTGVGIPSQDLNRVFERFYRVAKDRSRETGGTGIGLALVRHIVQLHGGRIWAESCLGQGTTVFFALPFE